MIKTILLDLDNTILDFNKAERNALIRALKDMGTEPTEEMIGRYSVLNLAQWKLLEQGKLTREQVKVRRYQLLYEEYHLDYSAEETARIYEQYLGNGHYFMEGAEEMLAALASEYDLYIVTNGTAKVQEGRLKSANIAGYFKDIFISEYIGFNKPSREFFDSCFARIPEFEKEESVLIGDSLTSDIQGGINAGVRTIWFHPEGEENHTDIHPNYEVVSLAEIPELIRKI